MKQSNPKEKHWQLMRERFYIADRCPPAEKRKEREIGSILSDILKQEPPQEALPGILADRWMLIVGEQIARHTAPAMLKNKILYVYADHPGWLAEVKRLPKQRLLKKTSSVPGVPDISDIRFQLDPAVQTWRNRE